MRFRTFQVKSLWFWLPALALLGASSSWLRADGRAYKVIVNPSISINSISRDELSRIFLKKSSKFHDGHSAAPVDLSGNSAVRDAFSREVHGKPAAAVEAYWQQQIFAGKELPPPEHSEAAATEFVRSNSSGIGYVSSKAATDGVKVIDITD